MTQPAKVIGFLDLVSGWDPSLAFVMCGAIGVHFIAYRFQPKLKKPLYAEDFNLPTRTDVSMKLIGGAALFGAGWALGGFCPGPALVSTVSLQPPALIFTAAMVAGMVFHGVLNKSPDGEQPLSA
jgi:hypothetical protein